MEELLKKIHEKIEEERRNYKGPYCCLTMDARIAAEYPVLYHDSSHDEYGVNLSKGKMIMNYCMFCGKKLSELLRDE